MTAPVRIEAKAWTDPRFATVARLLNFADLEHALIKVAKIWSWQAENYTPEAPTYVVDADTIESALGAAGAAAALVRAKLAEELPEGYRMRGSVGRIEWLHKCRVSALKGGEATKRNSRYKREPDGYPDGQPNDKPNEGRTPSPLTLDLPPEALSLPRAAPRGTEPTHDHHTPAPEATGNSVPAPVVTPIAREHADRKRRILATAWADAYREFSAVQAEGIDPTAPNMWAGLPSASSPPMVNLRTIVDELLVGERPDYDGASETLRRRILVAGAEARRSDRRTTEYMTPARMWNRDSFAIAAALSPEQAAREPRAGPRSSGPRRDQPYQQPGIRKIPQL